MKLEYSNSWFKQLSLRLWSITFNLLKHRNQILHESDAIQRLSGIDTLRTSVIAEYTSSQDVLPMSYTSFFYLPLPILLRKSHT